MKYCPKCGYSNTDDSKFCVMCGYRFDLEKSSKPHNYRRILIPTAIALVAIVALVFAMPTISAMLNPDAQVIVFSASEAHSVFGGNWQVLQNETYLKTYPTENVTVTYANGTAVTIPYKHYIKSVNHEVLIGNLSGNEVLMKIELVKLTNNTEVFRHMIRHAGITQQFGFGWGQFNVSFVTTTYDGYTISYFSTTFRYPHTTFLAVGNNTIIQITLYGYVASLSQMEQVLNQIS